MGLKVTHVEVASTVANHAKKLEKGKKPKEFTLSTDSKGASGSSISGTIGAGGKTYNLTANAGRNSFNEYDLRETAAFFIELADNLSAAA